jgi:hypothetical protein
VTPPSCEVAIVYWSMAVLRDAKRREPRKLLDELCLHPVQSGHIRAQHETIYAREGRPLSWAPSADAVAGNGRPLSWAPSTDTIAGGEGV